MLELLHEAYLLVTALAELPLSYSPLKLFSQNCKVKMHRSLLKVVFCVTFANHGLEGKCVCIVSRFSEMNHSPF